MTLLEAARNAGISIPTLCHHEKLEPFGGCRLCMVEVEFKRLGQAVVACVYPVEKNLVVRTRSEKIDKIRKTILELLSRMPRTRWIAGVGSGVRRGQGPLRKGGLLLHSLRPVCPLLRRGQEKARCRLRRQRNPKGDQLHPGDRRQECWNCKECFHSARPRLYRRLTS